MDLYIALSCTLLLFDCTCGFIAKLRTWETCSAKTRSALHPPPRGKGLHSLLKPCPFCLQSRLKFMIRDVADLRRNRWQERRKTEGPKTIEEIHRDARMEQQQAARIPDARGGPRGGGGFGQQPPMGTRPPMHLQ